jgi:hydrogenase maturation protein HypF
VRNTSAGVEIAVDGPTEALRAFAEAVRAEAPPAARIDSVTWRARAPNGFRRFTIAASETQPEGRQPVSPDLAVCAACLHELFDPADRRYQYPFINCTHCGPRFTIIHSLPYDRPQTTMAGFGLCPDCQREYADPGDRRFHAQPIACPVCGPQVWLAPAGSAAPAARGAPAVQAARERLAAGGIVAVKGLGGFHLACDAGNPAAVARLRQRKGRGDKPFAVMVADLTAARASARIAPAEAALLAGRERPIVIVTREEAIGIAPEVAPGQSTLGVMLPYTPLHHLLLRRAEGFPAALVMTSGNVSDQPLIIDNDEALQRLDGLADAWLLHDRPIRARCDDSVVRGPVPGRGAVNGQVVRRARGLAPEPLRLPRAAPPLLAAGAELKNTFCLAEGREGFLSQHIGDLENYETLQAFEASVAHFERLFRIRPRIFACDLHPDYIATRYAAERARREGRPLVGVQHHHAHLAACLADNNWPGDRPAIGVIFDGAGYGPDGAVWGGELLVGGYAASERAGHLAYVPLPGGDAAACAPWRMALAWLQHAGLAWDDDLPPVAAAGHRLQAVRRQIESGLNAPPTSSVGRLFDAVAALIGVRQRATYEAQAAVELEACADWAETGAYPFEVGEGRVDPAPAIRAIVADWRRGVGPGCVAARFHRGLASAVRQAAEQIGRSAGTNTVALSGGTWQNQGLLRLTAAELEDAGFTVLFHRAAPCNDGGLALGQAACAAEQLAAGG